MHKSILNVLSTLCLSAFCLYNTQAQQAISASGSDASGTGGSVSYTVGQVAYTSASGTEGSVSQGVQQAYQITVIEGVDQAGIELQLQAYPNPTADFLTLQTEKIPEKCEAYLYNLNGELLTIFSVESTQTSIDMSGLPTSEYILKVVSDSKSVKIFRIIKY
jgi:hypothetical protein